MDPEVIFIVIPFLAHVEYLFPVFSHDTLRVQGRKLLI